MRNLTRGVVVALLAAAAVAATAPSASAACVTFSGDHDVLVYVAKPVPLYVYDPGTITVSATDCARTVQEAVDQH